jgi:predicted DNA-binding protein
MDEHANLNFRLPEEKRAELFEISKRNGLSVSSIMRNLVFKYIEENTLAK